MKWRTIHRMLRVTLMCVGIAWASACTDDSATQEGEFVVFRIAIDDPTAEGLWIGVGRGGVSSTRYRTDADAKDWARENEELPEVVTKSITVDMDGDTYVGKEIYYGQGAADLEEESLAVTILGRQLGGGAAEVILDTKMPVRLEAYRQEDEAGKGDMRVERIDPQGAESMLPAKFAAGEHQLVLTIVGRMPNE